MLLEGTLVNVVGGEVVNVVGGTLFNLVEGNVGQCGGREHWYMR